MAIGPCNVDYRGSTASAPASCCIACGRSAALPSSATPTQAPLPRSPRRRLAICQRYAAVADAPTSIRRRTLRLLNPPQRARGPFVGSLSRAIARNLHMSDLLPPSIAIRIATDQSSDTAGELQAARRLSASRCSKRKNMVPALSHFRSTCGSCSPMRAKAH